MIEPGKDYAEALPEELFRAYPAKRERGKDL